MLIYANYLKAVGSSAKQEILRALRCWLKEERDGHDISPELLVVTSPTVAIGDTKLKTIAARDRTQELYVWTFKRQDKSTRGRMWRTEIGLKVVGDSNELSCVLTMEEEGVLVREIPQASKPTVVQYIIENLYKAGIKFDESIPGLQVIEAENKEACLQLKQIVNEINKEYSIVLVSPTLDGGYLIDVDRLQELLVGLAQVVRISTNVSQVKISDYLGEISLPINGGVSLLYIPEPCGKIKSHLFLSDEIEEWSDSEDDRIHKIFEWVTHSTNLSRFRKRFRPEGARIFSINSNIEKSSFMQNFTEDELRNNYGLLLSNLKDQSEIIAEYNSTNDSLIEQIDCFRKEKYLMIDKIKIIEKALNRVNSFEEARDNSSTQFLLEILRSGKAPTPIECLRILESCYANNCEILDSAKNSAKEYTHFSQGSRLLDNLIVLVDKYRECLLSGKGDAEAKNLFPPNVFASTESDTVKQSKKYKDLRTFNFHGESVSMFKHLKIGIGGDPAGTIRVYFHWDNEKEKIIVGYCGKHLRIASR